MKYWVYKESRILGPFDKESVSGLDGVDSGTLVCAGDPARGSWIPAGELDGLSGIAAAGAGGLLEEFPSGMSLLDQLQIDTAGLLSDDEFPDALSDELFQDGAFKKDFQDILSDRISTDEAAARRARNKIVELTTQLESMYRHVSELEAGQTDLARRLAEKEQELVARVAAAAAEPRTFLSPAVPPIPGGAPPVAAVPGAEPPPADWPAVPGADAAGFPSFPGAEPVAPAAPIVPAAPALPDIPSFASAAGPTAPSEAAPLEPPAAPALKAVSFGKPKSFKIVPTVKAFKVLGADEVVPAASPNPVPEFSIEPPAPSAEPPVAAAESAPLASAPVPAPVVPAPVTLTPVPPPPVVLAPVVPVPAVVQTTEAAQVINPFTVPAPLTPAVAPPNTLSRSQPVPDLTTGDASGSADAAAPSAPPATMAQSGGGAATADVAASRFAKPEPAPPTGEIKKPGRNNKTFLIAGGVLVTLLVILGVIFMRQPKDDLKQMATLDDGKAPIGTPADESAASAPPIVKPKIAQPAPEAPPAPPPGPSPEHTAAIALVKDFPLDGDRGTVGRWLQYSYTASPGAGAEEWNASTTGDNTVLVEYRLVPGASGGKGALYLFEVDPNGIVMGKNIEARQMLAGGSPPEASKAKKKPVKKAPVRRRAVRETPKEVPLLPLPDSGELRPPAEDDGTFGSDTINSGI